VALSAVSRSRSLRPLVALVAGLLLAEAGAFAVARLTGLGSVTAMRTHRALLAGAVAGSAEARALAADRPGYEVLQPYLGYVWDPRADLSADVYLRDVSVGPLGFPRLERATDPGVDAGAEPFDVGLFGGSVAWILYLDGGDALVAALRRHAPLAERPIRLHGFALPGYKQPQQLMTLAYLLSQGVELDLAINLDGVNEVVLPAFEAVPAGVHPSYPRSWQVRVEGIPDLATQLRAGHLAHLGEKRRLLARRFSRRGVELSATWNLLWWGLDRRLALRAAALAERPSGTGPGDDEGSGRYAVTGPPFEPGPAGLHPALARQWAAASLQMARLAAGNGIDYVHFLQPNQYVPDSKPLSREERALFVQPEHPYRAAVEAGYPHLVAQADGLRGRGVAFHDLRLLFADEPATVYSDSCCHLNSLGNELLATAIGEAVVVGLTERGALYEAGSVSPSSMR
jgi:hypothetical protein